MEKHNVGDVYGVITPAINDNELAWLANRVKHVNKLLSDIR